MSLATINVSGFLGKDAELRFLQSGQPVLDFSVAVDGRPDAQGQKTTDWFRCSMFGNRGEKLVEHLKKGTGVAVCGRFSTRSYTDKEGATRVNLEIAVNELDFTTKKENGGEQASAGSRPARRAPEPTLEEDFPF